jgi:S-adenosylmethionine decarboxylase proenzyme
VEVFVGADIQKKLSEHRYVEFEAPAEKLDHRDNIVAVLRQAADLMGAKVLDVSAHKFEPQGVTAMLLLSTSHLAIHTWPEHERAQLDVLSCKEGVPLEPAIDHVVRALSGTIKEIRKGQDMQNPATDEVYASVTDILGKASDREVAQTLVSLNARLGQKQGMNEGDSLMLRCVIEELDRRGLADGDAPAIAHLVKDAPAEPRDTALAHPGTDGGQTPVDPDDALYAWDSPLVLRSPVVSIGDASCAKGDAAADVDVLLHGPLSDELRHIIEHRLGGALPQELTQRMQVHPDVLGEPFTDHVPVYDLALVPSQRPRRVVRMSDDEPAVEWLEPWDPNELEKASPSDEVPGNPFFTTYGTLTRFAGKILPLFPKEFKRYVELFCGNIEMLWCIPRDFHGHGEEVVNDLDKDIIRLHRTCQKLSEASAKTLAGMNWRCAHETFNRLAKEGRGGSDLAFMHRELYLRRFSYLGREKLKLRSTDVGKDYDPLPRILRCKARLQGVKLSNQDYRKAVAQYDSPDTMWFIDPPYPGSDDYYQLKMPSLEEQMQHFDKLKGKALIVLKGDAKELAPVTKRKSWRQFKFRWPHPWKGVFPGKYPEWQYGSIFTNYDPPGKSRARKAWQVPLGKVSDDALTAYPKEDKPHEAVVQVHSRGKSVHLDLRMLTNGHLVGWTLLMQKPGVVSDMETPDEVRSLYGGYTVKDGNEFFKPIKAPVRVQAAPKELHPVEWLKVSGMVAGEGEPGATANERGVIVAVASPTAQWGLQSKDFHEYFLEGNSQWQGSLYLRRVKVPREGGDLEPVWLAWISETNLPRVLGSGEADMPPLGHSAMPRSLMRATPAELRFWEAKTEDEAKQLRDKLVASKFFTDQNVRIVDGAYERIVTKMYIDKEAKPEVGSDGRIKCIVSGASLRNTWHPCDPAWIDSEQGCHGSCCHSSSNNAGPVVTPKEAPALRKRGAKIKGGEVQAQGKLCFFHNDKGLCDLHNTGDKPLECHVYPLKILPSGTVVVRHRHYQIKCHKASGGVPGYQAYAGALQALFGPAQTKRIQQEAAKGTDRIEASMDPEIFKAMQHIAKTRIANRQGQGLPSGWGKAEAEAEDVDELAKGRHGDHHKASGRGSLFRAHNCSYPMEWSKTGKLNGPKCGKPATKAIIWADGRAYVPVCTDHVEPGKRFLEKHNGDWAEIVGTRDLPASNEEGVKLWHQRMKGRGWHKKNYPSMYKAEAEDLLAKSAGDTVQLLKTKDEQYVLGIVLEPNDGKDGVPMEPDTQGDIYSKAEVRQAAHKFMVEYRNVGLMHRSLVNGMVEILESFVVPDGTGGFDIEDPYGEKQHVREGTWLLGLRIADANLWGKVKRNELSGLSIGGSARRVSAAKG